MEQTKVLVDKETTGQLQKPHSDVLQCDHVLTGQISDKLHPGDSPLE